MSNSTTVTFQNVAATTAHIESNAASIAAALQTLASQSETGEAALHALCEVYYENQQCIHEEHFYSKAQYEYFLRMQEVLMSICHIALTGEKEVCHA